MLGLLRSLCMMGGTCECIAASPRAISSAMLMRSRHCGLPVVSSADSFNLSCKKSNRDPPCMYSITILNVGVMLTPSKATMLGCFRQLLLFHSDLT